MDDPTRLPDVPAWSGGRHVLLFSLQGISDMKPTTGIDTQAGMTGGLDRASGDKAPAASRATQPRPSGQNSRDDVAVDIGEPELPALIAGGEPGVVDA